MLQYGTDAGFYVEAGPQGGFKSKDVPDSTLEVFAKGGDRSFGPGLGFHSKVGSGIGSRYLVGISKIGNFDSGNINPNFENSVRQFSMFFTFLVTKSK